MNVAELAERVTALLAAAMPRLQQAGDETREEANEPLDSGTGEAAQTIWQRLQPGLEARPSVLEATDDLANEPNNPDFQAALRVQLRKILSSDATLAAELAQDLESAFQTAPAVAAPRPVSVAQQERGRTPSASLERATEQLTASVTGGGSAAQEGAVAAGAGGVAVGGDTGNVQVVYAEKGATVVIGDAPVRMTAVDRDTALGRYLQHIISRNRSLQLQGIRSGGRLVHIELDRIYIRLRALSSAWLPLKNAGWTRKGRWRRPAKEPGG